MAFSARVSAIFLSSILLLLFGVIALLTLYGLTLLKCTYADKVDVSLLMCLRFGAIVVTVCTHWLRRSHIMLQDILFLLLLKPCWNRPGWSLILADIGIAGGRFSSTLYIPLAPGAIEVLAGSSC